MNMGGTSFVKNVALNVAQGFNVLSADIPENAEVNSVYKVVARVENGEAKEAGSYRAELWMNDGVVATAETPALEASKEYDFEFSVIPHAVGAAETFVKFTAETGTAASETVNVTVNKEKGSPCRNSDGNGYCRSCRLLLQVLKDRDYLSEISHQSACRYENQRNPVLRNALFKEHHILCRCLDWKCG